jgi:hypothetical protein
MTDLVTLEQVQALAARLPPKEQLKLVARIGQQLSASLESQQAPVRSAVEEADALIAELDAVAASIAGDFDSVEDIRKNRAEQTDRL